MAVDTTPARLGELVRRHFVLQDERPDGVEQVEIDALDPFLRSLVFTDGTVTRALAVQTLAPVTVRRLSQEEVPAPAEATAYLDAEVGALSTRRRVEIRSGSSPLLWAESYLLAERLPAGFFGRLENAADGIGQSLRSIESFRELLWFGIDALPVWAPAPERSVSIRRLYRLISERRAAILISESFLVERRSGAYWLSGFAPSVPVDWSTQRGSR
jgi:chorismate-pyruvate lyase